MFVRHLTRPVLTRSDTKGKNVSEVNHKLKLLCLENTFSFLLHSNIKKNMPK